MRKIIVMGVSQSDDQAVILQKLREIAQAADLKGEIIVATPSGHNDYKWQRYPGVETDVQSSNLDTRRSHSTIKNAIMDLVSIYKSSICVLYSAEKFLEFKSKFRISGNNPYLVLDPENLPSFQDQQEGVSISQIRSPILKDYLKTTGQ